MIYNFEDLRPVSNYPKYPPYVNSDNDYLETYFYNFYLKNKDKFDAKGKTLIPIWWTTLAVDNVPVPIQEYINVLPRNLSWFAVSQYDDGIKYQLPPNTLHFGAGGNGGGIPIPLISSPLPEYTSILNHPKPFLFSFVGSTTHPIRQMIYNYFNDKKSHGIYLSDPKNWSQTVDHNSLLEFINTTKSSIFALAPRGYGLSSFRLYEIMQLGAVPVYISDKHWLPWTDELDWNEFCIILKPEDIPNLYTILSTIPYHKIELMLEKAKEIYDSYFSLEGVCQQILKRL